MSSRLSMQSKKRLVALHSVDKKNQYNNLYKDIKINKAKIQKDLQWLHDKFEHLSINDPDLGDKKISRADFYVYGGSLVAHQQASLVHSYLYANLSEMIDLSDMEELGARQTLVIQDAELDKARDKKQKTFSPEDLQSIVSFVNRNSRTFRSTESKQSQISKSLSKSKEASDQKNSDKVIG